MLLLIALAPGSCATALLRSGENLSDAVADLLAVPHLQALLLNCSSPAAVTEGLRILRDLAPEGVTTGAYANGFQVTTSQWLGGGEPSTGEASAGAHLPSLLPSSPNRNGATLTSVDLAVEWI
jgi:S-methylmethionine-dependent homocysteine/selenocysteine methylase